MHNDMFNVKPVNESMEMDILNRLRAMNESTEVDTEDKKEVNECDDAKKEVNEGTAFETKQQTDAMDDAKICPECFAEMSVVDNANLNYCPQCGTKLQMAEDNTIEEELDIALHEYVTYMRRGRVNEAMNVLRTNEATAVTDEDGEVYLEAYKIKVDADGNKKKVKVKTKKKKLTAAQKAALRKARKAAHKAGANKARAKAMKVRKRLGL